VGGAGPLGWRLLNPFRMMTGRRAPVRVVRGVR
jgi:hypothetical protein